MLKVVPVEMPISILLLEVIEIGTKNEKIKNVKNAWI